MPNQSPGSSAGSTLNGGALRSLLRNLLIVAVVGALAGWALSFRSEVSQALRESLPEIPSVAPQVGQSDDAYDAAGYDDEMDDEAHDAADDAADDEPTLASEITIRKDASGHFLLKASVEGVAIRFLVDTGASDVVLSPEDAQRLHLNSSQLDYSLAYQTANGLVRAAPVTLRNLRIGQLELYDLDASVNEAPMSISLLGMAFLERLDSYAVEGDRLILRW